MQILVGILIFLLAAVYVFIVNSFALESVALLKALVLPMMILLLLVYRTSLISWKQFLDRRGKWFLLFWGTVFLQILVLATGGLQSPFLILIHLFMVGLSFLFSFTIGLLFLFFSFAVLFVEIAVSEDIVQFIADKPRVIILQLASLIPIIAVAYIISQQYRLKDMLANILGTKVRTDEAILERLNELIIITDSDLNILSVNDAVERALQKSRMELLQKPLFPTLLLKNTDGKLIDKSYFLDEDNNSSQMLSTYLAESTLVNSSTKQKKIMLQAQPIEDTDGKLSQISFILTYLDRGISEQAVGDVSIERAKAKHEAISQDLKNKLLRENDTDTLQRVLLINALEEDVFIIQSLKNQEMKSTQSHIDIAQLCKQTVLQQQEFAKIFQTSVSFEMINFDWKKIAPLTVKNYPVIPEHLTGPFFTVECDVKKMGLLVKKVLTLMIFLASTDPDGQVRLNVEPAGNEDVLVHIMSNSPMLTDEELKQLFTPYYGSLATKTNLQAGSGLEGYIVKALSESMDLSLEKTYLDTPTPTLMFAIKLKKSFSVHFPQK